MNPVLERLAANVYREPYASDGKINGIFAPAKRLPKSVALTKPVLQINGPRRISYLCFDIDRPYGGIAWDDANLPVPNIVVVNPANLHAHLIYELAEPIWLRKAGDDRPGEALPVRYLKAVQKAIGNALDADTSYNGLMAKNPFHASWGVSYGRSRPYSLGELSEHLDLTNLPNTASLVDSPEGRNCTLFNSVRVWAYRHLRHYTCLGTFKEAITGEVDRLNNSFSDPLPWKETVHISKSVATWVWNTYTGSGSIKRRGIMGLDPSESLQLRQQKGQAYSSRVIRESNLDRVTIAVRFLFNQGKRLTRVAVASLCGLNRNTVARYWQVAVNGVASLRDKSSTVATPQDQGDILTPTRSSNPDALTYQDVIEQHKDDPGRVVRAIVYAIKQAKKGIVILGVPENLKLRLQRTVDMWRNTRTLNDERITERAI